MKRSLREVALPTLMQGHWVDADDPATELVIAGGEITCFGVPVEYDFKEVSEVDGALTVDLGINDESKVDSFQRNNITGLVLTPNGEFLVYNVKFGARFIRSSSCDRE